MVIATVITASILHATAAPRAEACVARFERVWAETRDLGFNMLKAERLKSGRTVREEITIKFRKPKTLYVAQVVPATGQEAIYDPRRDRHELIAHPGRFPDFTLNLDIYGRHATKDQHHPVSHIDFGYTIAMIRRTLEDARASRHGERVQYLGHEKVRGREAERVRLLGGDAPWRSIVARDDESVFAFAARVGADAYVIFYNNPSIDSLTDELVGGARYRVPPYYSPKLDLWFDVDTGMLRKLEARDFQGRLYERFEYTEMRLNPGFTDRDFDPDNPDYDF